ncbi:hypothetical protein [Mycobacterium uberis]|nr:hypothetical protein [Mycobacterium uberis]
MTANLPQMAMGAAVANPGNLPTTREMIAAELALFKELPGRYEDAV